MKRAVSELDNRQPTMDGFLEKCKPSSASSAASAPCIPDPPPREPSQLSPCDPRTMQVPNDFCLQADSNSEPESEAESGPSSSSTQKNTGFEHILGAHRWKSLVWIEEGKKLKDEETEQCFQVIQFGEKNDKKQKLFPLFSPFPRKTSSFNGWASKIGFKRIVTFLSCLENEYALWDIESDREMHVAKWIQMKMNASSKVAIKCITHDIVCSTSVISNISKGQGVACPGCHSRFNQWKDRYDEFVQKHVPEAAELVTTKLEWKKNCTGAFFKPTFKCLLHPEVGLITTTKINDLVTGKQTGVGCKLCAGRQLNPWKDRYHEFKCLISENNGTLLTSESEWIANCTTIHYRPLIQCNLHLDQTPITTTRVGSIKRGQAIGCPICCSTCNKWKNRYDEFKSSLPADIMILTTEEEWIENCKGKDYTPKLYCTKCKAIVTSTMISSITQRQGIGCACRNKTEARFYCWLNDVCIRILKRDISSLKDVRITPQARGPCVDGSNQPTHYDIELTFDDGFIVRFEIDGNQHFDKSHPMFTMEGCIRDKAKEEHSIGENISMIRVLQTDVWYDRNAWDDYCIKSIKQLHSEWKQGKAPRIALPPGNRWQYCDSDRSVYAELRR